MQFGNSAVGRKAHPRLGGAPEVGCTVKTNTEQVFRCLGVTEGGNEGSRGDMSQGAG